MRRPLVMSAMACVVLAALLVVAAVAAGGDQPATGAATQPTQPTRRTLPAGPIDSATLRERVGTPGIRRHLEALAAIAAGNGGNRAAGSPGDRASADYVVGQLRAAGYQPRTEAVTVSGFTARRAELVLTGGPGPALAAGRDYELAQFSPSGRADAPVAAVDLRLPPGGAASTSGCQASDFAGFPRGAVALLQRGSCTYRVKASAAERAGASAVLVFNEGQAGRRDLVPATLGGPGVGIPTFSLTFAAGERLARLGELARVRLAADTAVQTLQTRDVLAELPGSDPERVVMVGAHLDSVPTGPGLNDNGSGSATLLELARAMAGTRPKPTIRFAWWGAEELGLVGSTRYVEELADAEVRRIALYLNLDMVASPNFARLVYDPAGAPPGSAAVADVLTGWFASQRLASELVGFGSRSDHAPFRAKGIPVGGLFSGAEGDKSRAQAAGAGGQAGQPFDACYHQACDDLDNIDPTGLDQLADAAAHALATFAAGTEAVDRQRAAGGGSNG
jgi:Zn-dependent M28 family amino/carboxypeptidase